MTTPWPPRTLTRQGSAWLCIILVCPLGSVGADWPQFRGATHDGISTDRLNKTWAGAVTNPLWRVSMPNCLGSLATSGGRIFTQTKRRMDGLDREVCVALSAAAGAELWATPVEVADYPHGGVGPDDGPRTTPATDGESVFVLTSYLKLYRLSAATGSVVWQKDLLALYGGSVISWQNAASPVLEDGLVFVNANCGTSTLMALRSSDGSVSWRSQDEAMTHATPVVATIAGVRQVIFPTQSGLVSLEPLSGSRLWKTVYPFNYSSSLAVSPVVHQDMVFVCGHHGYGMGSVVWQVSLSDGAWTTARLWSTNNPASHWMTPVAHQGFLYGPFGIQSYDSPRAQLKCIEMRTGAVRWSVNDFGRGATLLVDDRLLTLTEKGELVLLEPTPQAYTELARFLAIPGYNSFTNRCWNMPAVSDGWVYLRSTAFVAAFDFSLPDLKLDPPQPLAAGQLRLTVRTADGRPLSANRLAGVQVLATSNAAQHVADWLVLTNAPVLTGGVARIERVQAGTRRFFIVNETE